MTCFEQSHLCISLNFSDPILVSQGFEPDQVRIRMLKSYFMVASSFISTQQLPQNPSRRELLDTVEEDAEYFTVTQDIPRQVEDQGQLETM